MSCVIAVHSLQSTGRWCVARVGLSLTTGTEQERLARSTSKSIHYCLCIYNMYVAASIWWSGLYYAMQGVLWYAMSSLLFSKCTGFCMKACEPYIPWMHDKKHTQYVALLQALNPSFSSMYCVCMQHWKGGSAYTYYTSAKIHTMIVLSL